MRLERFETEPATAAGSGGGDEDGGGGGIAFHEHLTVIAGLGEGDGRAFADLLIDAAAAPDGGLRWRDGTGEPGSVALSEAASLDDQHLRSTCIVMSADIVRTASGRSVDEREGSIDAHLRQQIAGASADVARLQTRIRAARLGHHKAADVARRLADADGELLVAGAGGARRRHARRLVELERARAEVAVQAGGDAGAADDDALVASGVELERLTAIWRTADDHLSACAAAFGGRPRMAAPALHAALAAPDLVPPQTEGLVARCTAVEARRSDLERHRRDLASVEAPIAPNPIVAALAQQDQDAMWALAHDVLEADGRARSIALSLSGLGLGPSAELARTVDEAHERAGRARPWRRRRAEAAEAAALAAIGSDSYLAFQLRRVDASIDSTLQAQLDQAAAALDAAQARWHEVCPTTSAPDAVALEFEVRSHADALADADRAATGLETVAAALDALAVERSALQSDIVATSGRRPGPGTPAAAIVVAITERVEAWTAAHLQAEVELAEHDAQRTWAPVDEMLARVGFADGEPGGRLAGAAWAVEAARQRAAARRRPRCSGDACRDLAALESLVAAGTTPEWGDLGEDTHGGLLPSDADDVDTTALEATVAALRSAHHRSLAGLDDPEVLRDRQRAVERRVATLEQELTAATATADDGIDGRLVARVAAARAGRDGLPLLLVDPLRRITGERKWELLDLVGRLSAGTQLVYLTDDPDVVVWARRQRRGTLRLLEPMCEPEVA